MTRVREIVQIKVNILYTSQTQFAKYET